MNRNLSIHFATLPHAWKFYAWLRQEKIRYEATEFLMKPHSGVQVNCKVDCTENQYLVTVLKFAK